MWIPSPSLPIPNDPSLIPVCPMPVAARYRDRRGLRKRTRLFHAQECRRWLWTKIRSQVSDQFNQEEQSGVKWRGWLPARPAPCGVGEISSCSGTDAPGNAIPAGPGTPGFHGTQHRHSRPCPGRGPGPPSARGCRGGGVGAGHMGRPSCVRWPGLILGLLVGRQPQWRRSYRFCEVPDHVPQLRLELRRWPRNRRHRR